MPSSFERIATVLGAIGMICLAVGAWTKSTLLTWLGYLLGAPLILGALVAAFVSLPLLLIERRRMKQQDDGTKDEADRH